MNNKLTFLFSGQGSQYFGMGGEMLATNQTFRRWMTKLEVQVRDRTGSSVLEILHKPGREKGEAFVRTSISHPALFMVQYSLAQVVMELGILPDFVLGTSLGEFVAAAVSGAMGFEEALDAVIDQALCLETSCPRGGMVAILNGPELFWNTELCRLSELAGVNFKRHFVVAAAQERSGEISRFLDAREVQHILLQVSFPFHSSFIDPAESAFLKCIESLAWVRPSLPWLSCARCEWLDEVPREYLWEVVRRPMHFERAIAVLESMGDGMDYLDLGPSGTLAMFVKYNLSKTSSSRFFPILTPFGRDREGLERAVASLLASNQVPVN